MVIPLSSVLLFRTVLTILGVLCNKRKLKIAIFLFLWRIVLEFWWAFHWIYRLLVLGWPFSLYYSYQHMILGDSFIFWNVLQFLPLVSKLFYYTNLFTCLVRVIPGLPPSHTHKFWKEMFPLFFSFCLLILFRNITDFWMLVFLKLKVDMFYIIWGYFERIGDYAHFQLQSSEGGICWRQPFNAECSKTSFAYCLAVGLCSCSIC